MTDVASLTLEFVFSLAGIRQEVSRSDSENPRAQQRDGADRGRVHCAV